MRYIVLVKGKKLRLWFAILAFLAKSPQASRDATSGRCILDCCCESPCHHNYRHHRKLVPP